MGTFDPHGNQDEEFLRHADFAFTVKFFPHYDSYLQGERAARALVRAIRGDYTPAHATLKVPIITATVLQWTGASPWMDLVNRALIWEAREPDAFVNVFFGFPFADVPTVGMTVQALTNGKPELAQAVVQDMADAAWRQRERLVKSARVHTVAEGVSLAKLAVAKGEAPVVLADHSDRSGYATWLLREIMAQDLGNTIVATLADGPAVERLRLQGVKEGDPFDLAVGGLADESAGDPVRVVGTVLRTAEVFGHHWIAIGFGRGNVLILSSHLAQIIDPAWLTDFGLDIASFDVFAIKSRVHFRRGFDDNGFAKTILLVEPTEPFLGTVRLEGLKYESIALEQFYPYGTPDFRRDHQKPARWHAPLP